MTDVKICGLSTPDTLATAIESGARFVGFVFYEPSPRNVSFDTAWNLARAVPTGVRSVGLFVNPTDEELERILTGVQLDMIQLSGDESPGRIAEIKSRYHQPIIKSIHIGSEEDLQKVEGYEASADWLLFDTKLAAKPSNHPTFQSSNLPTYGGTGESFDWNILANRKFKKPWMLSGGLDAGNVQDALNLLNPTAVDISSGVESAKGVKDNEKIKSFIEAVKSHDQSQ